MTKLGDVIKGDSIGKRSKEWFVWTACPTCGKERWVRRGKTELRTYTGWCQSCSARRNNRMRDYNLKDKSLAWKGGRTKNCGYIEVKIYPDDFFYPMARKRGYVREHRLVMAKHLNRCLLAWEVVHHKNGNKQDNRIENLDLIGCEGKHNKEIDRLIKQARSEGYKAGYQQSLKEHEWDDGYYKGKKAGIEKGRQMIIKEIENSTVLSASVRDDMLEQRHKDWQTIKEGKDVNR